MARFLLDFDSSLNTLDEAQIRSVRERYNLHYTVEDIAHWDWWTKDAKPGAGDHVWGPDCFLSREWTLALRPQPFAWRAIRDLQAAGHEFFLVSDRPEHMREWLETWLEVWGFENIPVYLTERIENPKWNLAKQLNLDYAIEDSPHNITDFAQMGACPKGIFVVDKPWNRSLPGGYNHIRRVYTWFDIFDCFMDDTVREVLMTIQKIDGKTFIRPISNQERDDNYIVSLKETAQELADTMYKDIQHQITKFGAQRLTGLGWIAVITEEFGETVQAYLQKNPAEAKKEAKQAIACLVRLVAEIEREEKGLHEEESTLYVSPC